MKEILLIIFALLFVVGLIVFRLRFIKDRNPNAELLIEPQKRAHSPQLVAGSFNCLIEGSKKQGLFDE